MGKNQHVTKHQDGGWQVKGAGNSRATKRTETQKEAIDLAKEIAENQKSEVVIHGTNGQIRDKDSYGPDPNPPRDTKY
jgi:uncharacterized protein YdaT